MRNFLTVCLTLVCSGFVIANDFPRANVRVVETRNATRIRVSYRQPVGHTHTCVRCGDTWDHSKNPTHTCQRCGSSQYHIDQSRRMVQTYSLETVPMEVSTPVVRIGFPVANLPIVTVPQSVPTIRYTLPLQSGGCVGGNCPSSTSVGRFRIFR